MIRVTSCRASHTSCRKVFGFFGGIRFAPYSSFLLSRSGWAPASPKRGGHRQKRTRVRSEHFISTIDWRKSTYLIQITKSIQKAQVETFPFTVSKLCSFVFRLYFHTFFISLPHSHTTHKPSLIISLSHCGPRLCVPYIILLQRWGPGALTSSTSSYTMNHCAQISLALLSVEFSTGLRHNLLLDSCPENYSYTVTHKMMQKVQLHQM